MASDRLLTVEQVADQLGLNVETVRRYLRRGALKGIRFGNRGGWRIKETELEAFIERKNEEQPHP